MPLYEYKCERCGKEQEIFQKFDDPFPVCCEQEMKKQIGLSNFVLKGKGWYKTDYSLQKDKK